MSMKTYVPFINMIKESSIKYNNYYNNDNPVPSRLFTLFKILSTI